MPTTSAQMMSSAPGRPMPATPARPNSIPPAPPVPADLNPMPSPSSGLAPAGQPVAVRFGSR
jgi:hypothetical protein